MVLLVRNRVEDRERTEAYMGTPESAAVGEEAGAIDGEYWFLEEFPASRGRLRPTRTVQ